MIVPCDFVVRLSGGFDGVPGQVVEGDEVPDHADRLVEWAVAIVRRVAVLLQEVVLQELGHFEGDLVGLGERRLADELHDLRQILFLLQDLVHLRPERNVVREVLVVVVVESAHVLGVGDEPVDRGEVLALGELLVETPEHLTKKKM